MIYHVFAYLDYERSGGIHDYVGAYATLEEARAAAESHRWGSTFAEVADVVTAGQRGRLVPVAEWRRKATRHHAAGWHDVVTTLPALTDAEKLAVAVLARDDDAVVPLVDECMGRTREGGKFVPREKLVEALKEISLLTGRDEPHPACEINRLACEALLAVPAEATP